MKRRGALSALLNGLLALGLLWGVCAPCRQLLAQSTAHNNCCDSAGRCKTPQPQSQAQKPCQSPVAVLEHYVAPQPDPAAQLDLPLPAVTTPAQLAVVVEVPAVAVSPPGYTPPDLYPLHSAFLI
jgi:hypothetical protein